jgi:hypothetical protein
VPASGRPSAGAIPALRRSGPVRRRSRGCRIGRMSQASTNSLPMPRVRPLILAMLTTGVDERRSTKSRQRPSTPGRSAALDTSRWAMKNRDSPNGTLQPSRTGPPRGRSRADTSDIWWWNGRQGVLIGRWAKRDTGTRIVSPSPHVPLDDAVPIGLHFEARRDCCRNPVQFACN